MRCDPAIPARDQDDILLLLLLLHCTHAGTCAQIAWALGVEETTVAAAIDRIRQADLAESGEPPVKVRAAYRCGALPGRA